MANYRLIQRLQSLVDLSERDRSILANMPFTVRNFGDGDTTAREGDKVSQCAFVISGFLFRQKIVGTRAQILSVSVAGDMPDVQNLHLPVMDHDLISVGPSTIGFVSHSYLNNLLVNSPSLTHALWRATLVDAAIFREWVANLGSRDALSRIAHLLCELAARLEVVDLVEDNRFLLPFTQQHIADACGLSVVHVNRTIQELRQRELVEWERHSVVLLRRGELEEMAEFRPDYLHLRPGSPSR